MCKRRINFGLIGGGGIARRKTIPGLLRARNCRLVAVMNPSQAGEIAAEFGVERAYTRDTDLLADPEFGAVYLRAQLACWYPPMKGAWRQDPKLSDGAL